jgi:hypothetical protein
MIIIFPSVASPLLYHHTYDTVLVYKKISIALPIQSEIFLTAGGDINSGKIVAFER